MLAEEDIEGKVAVVLAGTQLVGDIQVAVEGSSGVDMIVQVGGSQAVALLVQVGGSQVVVLLVQVEGSQAARIQVAEPLVDIRVERRMQAVLLLLVESR